MAGYNTFHNKFHRSNHHTLSTFDVPDSGYDPIASKTKPFINVFYNTLTDLNRSFNIDTNSLEWYYALTTVETNSANWMLTKSLWTTVNSLSNNWNLGYNAYLTLQSFSASWESVYSTVSTNSANWGSPFLMFTNKVQTYTHSKTFSGQDLRLFGVSSYNWNLNTQQVAFVNVVQDIFINNPVINSVVFGGIYTLVLKNPNNYNIIFDNAYQINLNYQNKPLTGIVIINFLAMDDRLYGDVTSLSAIQAY